MDRNRSLKRARDWAATRVHLVNPLNGFPLLRRRFQPVVDVDAPDHQHVFFEFDFSGGLRNELIVAGIDLTRLQRASEGSRESTGGRSHDVVQRRSMRRILVRRNLVVFGDF